MKQFLYVFHKDEQVPSKQEILHKADYYYLTENYFCYTRWTNTIYNEDYEVFKRQVQEFLQAEINEFEWKKNNIDLYFKN